MLLLPKLVPRLARHLQVSYTVLLLCENNKRDIEHQQDLVYNESGIDFMILHTYHI